MDWSAIGIYTLAVGVVGFGVALYFFTLAADSRGWAEWPAVVVSSEIDDDSDGSYWVVVDYRWEINGETHRRKEQVKKWPGTRGSAARILATFPRGTRLTAYVDPARPSRSRLRAGVTTDHWIWLTIGAAIIVAGLASVAGVLD